MIKNDFSTQNTCIKCGVCCQKNGPVLHLIDLELVRKNILAPDSLVLLRRGEPAMDNISGKLVLLKKELIKVRGKKTGSWTCFFHDTRTNLCLIHKNRPFQCRVMECWNPQKITECYNEKTLSRKELLRKGSAMEEITLMHEEKCRVDSFMNLLRIEISSPGKKNQELNEMIAFDRQFRKTFQKKTKINKNCIDYYFGRSLNELIPAMARFIRSLSDT